MDRRTLLTACGLTAAAFALPAATSRAALRTAHSLAPEAGSFLAALHAEGVRTVQVGDWSRHNRNHKGPFYGNTGVMIHHTASEGTPGSVELCRGGRDDLPGPLCHGVIAKDGTVYLVGYGRANHAGLGDSRVLHALRADHPTPQPEAWDTDGNRYFFGFECINRGDGGDPWPPEQMEAIVAVSAALCRAHHWNANRVIGHKEWQKGKIDPEGFGMETLRSQIARRLASSPTTG